MAKFSGSVKVTPAASTPMATTGPAFTAEGGAGFGKDDKTALFTFAVTNMVREDTFYEAAAGRDTRFVDLVHRVAHDDPAWLAGFIPWLRDVANMRSAPVVAACEMVWAVGQSNDDVSLRRVVNRACVRADEPAEMLGYWLGTHGRAHGSGSLRMPMSLKRGIADAAQRLYDERNALKYDGDRRSVRMADVIELCHVAPTSPVQDALFRYLIERRHGHFEPNVDSIGALSDQGLTMVAHNQALESAAGDRRAMLTRPDVLANAGFTWERVSGWLPGGMDAAAWEAVIPSMGYMALLRNLRNFEEAKVSGIVLHAVAEKLADPDQVAKSRQFPFRFWSAYHHAGTSLFAPALEAALEYSMLNVPSFSGRTLVLVDTSGSMSQPISGRSQIPCVQVAGVFGASVAARSNADLVIYADTAHQLTPKSSVLRTVELLNSRVGSIGYGTNTWPALAKFYDGHDRVVVFTDGQDHPARHSDLPDVPIYVWDLAGYPVTNVSLDRPNRYLFGGFNDAAFRMIGLLEQGQSASWPWENVGTQ